MAEFASMRASVTGSAVPMHGYSYGNDKSESEGVYVEIKDANAERGAEDTDEQGAGNTVTFGGVETFATNSAAGSSLGGKDQRFVTVCYTMVCPSVRGDNPRALTSGLSPAQVDKSWYNCFIPPLSV